METLLLLDTILSVVLAALLFFLQSGVEASLAEDRYLGGRRLCFNPGEPKIPKWVPFPLAGLAVFAQLVIQDPLIQMPTFCSALGSVLGLLIWAINQPGKGGSKKND